MISPGALVTCRQTGTVLWVVKAPAPGGRWYLAAKQFDNRGRSAYQGRVAGAGDLTLIHDAETYQVGSTVTYQGLDHLVLEDRGDEVELGVPEHGSPLRGGGVLHVPAGNVTVISKGRLDA